jgi:hypothetical protein
VAPVRCPACLGASPAKPNGGWARAARNGYFVALDHMYFPGIGRLREEGVGYRWLPIPYVNDAKKR